LSEAGSPEIYLFEVLSGGAKEQSRDRNQEVRERPGDKAYKSGDQIHD
jgi:hypothetical protein